MLKRESAVVKDYSNFCPRKYYLEYYANVGAENRFLLDFFHNAYKRISSDTRVLEFGGGPTVYQILSAARRVKQIVFADFLEVNREQVRDWLNAKPQALNWDQYLDYVLKINGLQQNYSNRMKLREQVVPKITEIIQCDAYLPKPLGARSDDKFDIVSSNFCLECIDAREEVFIEIVEKMSNLVENNGKLILCMLQNASSYKLADINLPAFAVSPDYMHSLLSSLGYQEISISSLGAEKSQGYEGMFALSAKKRRI